MKPPKYLRLFFLLLFVSTSWESYAQAQKTKFEHLTIEQGLSHNFVMYMMQDRKGYLWFGTGNGLDKYDGYRFTNYKFDPHDSTSVPKNQVFMMWEDSDGMIWVGTSEGTCKFNPRTEKFTRLEKSTDNPYAFKFAQSFNEDAEGNQWVGGSFAGELRQIDRETGKFSATNYAAMLRPLSGSNPNTSNLHVTFRDKSGTLWVGSPFGLHRLESTPQRGGKPSKVSFTHYRHDPSDSNSLGGNRVTGIYEDRKGILWVMTLEGVLNAFDPKSGKFTRFEPDPENPLQIYGLLGTGITEDLAGNLWIGTLNGLYKLDKERKVFTAYFHDATDPGSIINNAIISLLVDKAGILWVATMGGVDKLDPNKKPFELYRHDPSNPRSLSHNSVAAICEDKEGVVWVGTRGDGLNALDKRTGDFTHYRHDLKDPGSLRSDTASAILEDRDGNLWIGNGEALSLFDRKEKAFTHYLLNHPFLHNPAASPIYTLYEDRQGIFWLGTDNGIIRFDRKTGKTISYPYDPNKPDRISDYWALAILEDSKGNLWIGPGSQALTRFDRKTGKFTHYKHDSRKPGSISSNTIPAIYEDSKGNLWFGTGEGGLCRFDYATETFTAYTEKHGLAGNAVFSILEDNAGNLWLGTNNGLSTFSPAKQTFTNYDADDGLQSKLFTALYTEAAASKGKDGTLYFGGINGFNAFHPAEIRPNRYIPPVIITQFKLFDKTIPGKEEAKDIELDYDQNFFSFEFAALNYTNSHKNQYAYQLEGVDKKWIYSGSRRLASYTDIGPGTYVFRVKGSNNDGIWNEQGTSVRLTIHPPFWRTWWAYTLYGLLFIAAVLLARREIVRRERLKANLKIKQVESDKLRELDTMKSHFFTNISHEFRTPLSLIQGTVEKLEKKNHSSPEGQDYQLISRNAERLLELINQLLDLSKLEAGKLELHPQPGEITGFLKILAGSFAFLFESKHIRYSCQIPSEPIWVRFDPDKLEKIFANLFSNAYKFTPSGGEVIFSVEKEERDASLCILKATLQDSGIGIPGAQLPKIFDRFHQVDASATRNNEGTGIGLALVKELVALHGGEVTVNSAENEGTAFRITLPLALATEKEARASAETTVQKDYSVPERFQPDSAPPVLNGNPAGNSAAQVLVVEDQADLRRFISDQLAEQYQVQQAENGLTGYALALDTVPDLIISDVMMPGLDGLGLCQQLKTDERTSHIPLILLTAKADWESKLQGLETGADDYLTKPFKMEELQARIKNLMESRKKLRERFSKQIHINPQEISVTSTDERFLQRVLSLLETNMANAGFDVEAFSKEIGLSRTHLHRKLTALTGQAPNEFIRTVRLKRAALLLQQHHGNISEIAYAVGFSSVSYFTKCFKDFYGVTPVRVRPSRNSLRCNRPLIFLVKPLLYPREGRT
jgi:signal transduction histidine kinase/ligand-binding sensor domain-containing protein/DNA-binding response OmpR family regulator